MLKNVISLAKVSLADRKGVTAAEYAVLATGIVVAVATAAALLGPRLGVILNGIAT